MFASLNRFEKWYLIIGFIINVVSAYLSRSDILAITCAICSLFNAVYAAKGNILSFVFGFVATFTYIFIAWSQSYYSEVLVNIVILLITSYGFINWLRNLNKDTNTIKMKALGKKEIVVSVLSQVALLYVYYRVFAYFGNGMVLVSSINMALTVLGFYYNARISKISYVVMILSCIFKGILWLVPVLNGDLSNTSVLISILLYLVCDIYGYVNWSRMEAQQAGN